MYKLGTLTRQLQFINGIENNKIHFNHLFLHHQTHWMSLKHTKSTDTATTVYDNNNNRAKHPIKAD